MKILHTSDWHLGRSLYGRKRYDEFSAFLEWLADLIESEGIDILLVAGDIFDTSTPSNRSQALYYRFLCKVSGSCCRHIVVTAGNHDSPTFLNAPKELLRALNVHVVGSITGNPEDEIIVIDDPEGENTPSAIICAVPYLRDRDIRFVRAGETIEDKHLKLIAGIKNHYDAVCGNAQLKQAALSKTESKIRNPRPPIPIIAMGHLFTAGGKTVDGDGVRELYVGSLAHVGEDIFPACIDYLALGHLHVPQKVGKSEHIRYSGSPIPMGFGEAGQEKSVVIIEFENLKLTPVDTDKKKLEKGLRKSVTSSDSPSINKHPLKITCHKVPCFQPLEKISGEIDEIMDKINALKLRDSHAWLEIEYDGTLIANDLKEQIDDAVALSAMKICRIKNRRIVERVMGRIHMNETLDDLDENDVFIRCLDAHEIAGDERRALIGSYNEIVTSFHEEDMNEV